MMTREHIHIPDNIHTHRSSSWSHILASHSIIFTQRCIVTTPGRTYLCTCRTHETTCSTPLRSHMKLPGTNATAIQTSSITDVLFFSSRASNIAKTLSTNCLENCSPTSHSQGRQHTASQLNHLRSTSHHFAFLACFFGDSRLRN